MQTNKIDKHIADKFKGRELKPSVSAWERLSVQLDEEQNKKNWKWFLYLGYAASIALLISIGFLYQGGSNNEGIINEVIVETFLDELKIKEIDLKEITPIEKAVVKLTDTEVENKIFYKRVEKKHFKKSKRNVIASVVKQTINVKPIVQKEESKIVSDVFVSSDVIALKKEEFTSRIKINSDDLLFTVTHSAQEVQEYYTKYKINKKSILETIQKELIKSNLRINPETILAEVELDIEEADFQQDFMGKFKSKLSNVIVAIADRNK